MNPEYTKAAKILADKESSIKLAKVNCTEEAKLNERFNLKGYPTLLFFKKGCLINYKGSRTSDAMVKWVERKSDDPAKLLTSANEAKKVLENNDIVIMGFFNNRSSLQANIYELVADSFDTFFFAIITDVEIFKDFAVTNTSVVLFNNIDEKKIKFNNEFTQNNLKTFVVNESRLLLMDLTPSNDREFLSGSDNIYLWFTDPSHKSTNETSRVLRSLANIYNPRVLFFIVDVTKKDREGVMNYLKISAKNAPTSLLLEVRGKDITKYKQIPEDFSENALKAFLKTYVDNKIKPYYLSQTLPSDWNSSSVYTLVQSNFIDVVFDNTKHVFVDFHAPWCYYCKIVGPVYKNLSTMFPERKDLIFAEIDVDENELGELSVEGLPTLKLYTKKNKKGIKYAGSRSLEDLESFIKKNIKKDTLREDSEEVDPK